MSLAQQWQQVQSGLPEDWSDARVQLRLHDEESALRAVSLLAPLQPSRAGREVRFYAVRHGVGPSPAAVGRGIERLDDERIPGTLTLLAAGEATTSTTASVDKSLVDEWNEAVEQLPDDWSDVYAEIELTSSDHLDPAALALAPVNPGRFGGTPGFRFRVARRSGYGASPQMVRRCLARLDERAIRGEVRILRVLSDTRPVGTQGPVWYVDGKVV